MFASVLQVSTSIAVTLLQVYDDMIEIGSLPSNQPIQFIIIIIDRQNAQ